MSQSEIVLFAGSANPKLAKAIARTLGVQSSCCKVERFPDGEVAVQLSDSVHQIEGFFRIPVDGLQPYQLSVRRYRKLCLL